MANDLEGILTLITSEGWQVRAMGQLSPDRWYATLHRFEDDGLYITPDRTAGDITNALTLAYEAIAAARWLPYLTPASGSLTAPAFTLASLGLGQGPSTFTLAKRFAR